MRTRQNLAPHPGAFRARATLTWPRRGRVASAILLAVTWGCGKGDLASELDRVRSWSSTTALAADRRAAGAIDRAVALQLVDRATEARTESARTLQELTASDSERAAASFLLDSLRDGIVGLRKAAR